MRRPGNFGSLDGFWFGAWSARHDPEKMHEHDENCRAAEHRLSRQYNNRYTRGPVKNATAYYLNFDPPKTGR